MFKVVNSDATKLISRIGILSRSFKDVQLDIKTLSSGGSIKNLFNIVTAKDVQNFNNYCNAISQGTPRISAFNSYIKSAPTAIRQQALEFTRQKHSLDLLNRSYAQGQITLQEYNAQSAMIKSKMASLESGIKSLTIAQRAAATASRLLSSAISMIGNVALSFGISFIISKIMELVNAQETYNQKIKESAEQAKQEMSEITDLYSQYRELSKAVETDSSKKSDLIKVTDTLLEKLGYEKSALQELTNEYGSLDDAIKNITIQGLQEKEDALISDYALKKNNLITDRNWFTDWFFSDKAKSMTIPLSIDYLVEDDPNLDKVFDVIKNSGIFREVSESTLTLNNSNETVEGVLKNYDDISKAIDILKEKFSSTDLSDNKIFTALVTQQTALKTNIDSYNGAISNLNSNVAQQQVLTALLGKELPSTQEEFDSFKDSLLASAETSEDWKDRFVGGTDAAKEAIISVLRQMPEFADFFQNEIPNSTDTANTFVATLTETFTALKKALEDIIGFSDTYKSAMAKIAAGTALTADEVMKLLEIDPTLFDKFSKSKDGWKIDLGELQASWSIQIDNKTKSITGKEKKEIQTQLNAAQEELNRLTAERAGLVTNDSVTRAMAANLDKQISETKSKIEQAKQDLGLSDMFAEMLDFTSIDLLDSSSEIVLDKIGDYNDGISSLNKAVDTMNEGNSLSYDEMTALVQLYPQLKNNIVETANGYTIEKSALEDVRQQTYKTRDTYIDSQIDMAISAIEQSKIRISQYETEISCINSIGNYQAAVASGLFENLNKEREKIKAAEDLIALLESLKNNVIDPGDSGKSNNKEIDILQQQIDYYKTLLEAIEIVTDKVIEGIEKEKEAIDSKIDKLNDEKDALQDKNDEQQRELDLIEAKNNLDKAKKQKVFVYKEGQGLVQVQDEKAVADAQKEYDNVQNEIKKAEIDKQIDALEKQNEALDKQIEGWNEYKDQFSNMENDVKDTLTVEQAKKALGTDEKGLLSLDEKTINGIRDGLAKAVYKKDVEDNKDNNKYVTVDMDTYLKQLGASVSYAEFQNIVNNLSSITPVANPMSNSTINNAQTINNTKTINSTFQFNIYDATDPQKVANEVHGYLKKLLTETINSTK